MSSVNGKALKARNGKQLEVIVACRVSTIGENKQDERSLDDQEAMHRDWMRNQTNLPTEVTVVAGSGSGESLTRKEYYKLEELVESGKFDLVLTEDLGRIVRRIHAHLFCELCVDNNVRLISLNDHVDTAEEGWEDRSIFSAWHHERSNRDNSSRIKRTHKNRFSNGGTLSLTVFGYVKSTAAKSDDDLLKDPSAEPIYQEWFRRLDEDDASFQEIADWLNTENVSTGPYCTKSRWDGTMVGQCTRNWILKGVRFRNKRKTRRNNSTGKYVSEKAPAEELVTRHVPHLAYFDEDYYDRVVAKIDARNGKYRRKKNATGGDCLSGRPKKRVRFPGQSVVCGICGHNYVFGGHGQTNRLMCDGARAHSCWNGVTFDGTLACSRISSAVLTEIENLPAFDPEFLVMVQKEVEQFDDVRSRSLSDLDHQKTRNDRGLKNIVLALRKTPASETLHQELEILEQEKRQLQHRHSELQELKSSAIEIPSVEELKAIAREDFSNMRETSFEFAKLMRSVATGITVFPVRLCDGGKIELRAKFQFSASSFISQNALMIRGLQQRLSTVVVVNLFDSPQREQFRPDVVRLRASNLTELKVASQLKITHTAAQRAAALQRMMDRMQISDPWLSVYEPPEDYTKLSRHRNSRYEFRPRPDFPKSL